MKKIYKIINIVLMFILMTAISVQDFAYALRPPLLFSEAAKEYNLVKELSSDDPGEIDRGLEHLDKTVSPDEVVFIVEKTFANRELILKNTGLIREEGEETPFYAVQIFDKDNKHLAGWAYFKESAADREKSIEFHSLFIDLKDELGLRGKRLLPLVCRWMMANPDFKKFYGWKIKVNNTSFMAARALWRSGFDDIKIRCVETERIIRDIREINERNTYDIDARFSHLGQAEEETMSIARNILKNGDKKEFFPGFPTTSFNTELLEVNKIDPKTQKAIDVFKAICKINFDWAASILMQPHMSHYMSTRPLVSNHSFLEYILKVDYDKSYLAAVLDRGIKLSKSSAYAQLITKAYKLDFYEEQISYLFARSFNRGLGDSAEKKTKLLSMLDNEDIAFLIDNYCYMLECRIREATNLKDEASLVENLRKEKLGFYIGAVADKPGIKKFLSPLSYKWLGLSEEGLPISIALHELQNNWDSLNLNPEVNPGTPIGDTFLERLDSGLLRQMIQSDIQRKTGENNKHLVYAISLAQKEDVAWLLKTLEELLPGEERDGWTVSLIAINIREQSLQAARSIVNSCENELKIHAYCLKADISDPAQISLLTELVSKNKLSGAVDGIMHNAGSAVSGTREKFYFQFLRKLCGNDSWLEVDREELRSAIDLKKLAPIEAKEYLEGDERYINRIRSCGFILMPTGREVPSGIFRAASGSEQEPVNKDLADALSGIFSEEDIKNKALEVLSKSGEFSEENLLKVGEFISEECESAIKSDIELSNKIKYLWIDERMLRDAQFLAYYSVNSYFSKRISKDIPVITRKLAYKALLIQHLYGTFEVIFSPGYTHYPTKKTGLWAYAYPETVSPKLAIVPFADLSRLNKTHVLFLGSDIIQNPSVFKETFKKLESNKSNVPVILLNDGDLFIDKAFVESVLNNAGLEDSSFRIIKNLDFLKQTVLNRAMVPVSGAKGIKCVPLTTPICEIYKELGVIKELMEGGGLLSAEVFKGIFPVNRSLLRIPMGMNPRRSEIAKEHVSEESIYSIIMAMDEKIRIFSSFTSELGYPKGARDIPLLFVNSKTLVKVKLLKDGVPLQIATAHLLLRKLRFLISNLQRILEFSSDKKRVIDEVIEICKKIEDVLNFDDKTLVTGLLQEVREVNDGRVDLRKRHDIDEIVENVPQIAAEARELVRAFKYEFIKGTLFKITRLCGETPEEVLKEWYGESLRENSLLSATKRLREAMTEYQISMAQQKRFGAFLLISGSSDRDLYEIGLIEKYTKLMMSINDFLVSYGEAGIPMTYVYPFMGPDIIPLVANKTKGINNDVKDFERGTNILWRLFSTDHSEYFNGYELRPRLAEYSDEKLDAMDIQSYVKVTKSIKGTKVLILKGFAEWTKRNYDSANVDKLLKDIFNTILQEGDMILALDKEDIDRFKGLAEESGFSKIGPSDDSLFHGVEGAVEDQKILQIPTALAIMRKEARIVPISEKITFFAPHTDL
ncbi:MAG: hypothetical protein WC312_04350 [Candidatus Omnitrophota bacterium]|jgi:hypothetical protein